MTYVTFIGIYTSAQCTVLATSGSAVRCIPMLGCQHVPFKTPNLLALRRVNGGISTSPRKVHLARLWQTSYSILSVHLNADVHWQVL